MTLGLGHDSDPCLQRASPIHRRLAQRWLRRHGDVARDSGLCTTVTGHAEQAPLLCPPQDEHLKAVGFLPGHMLKIKKRFALSLHCRASRRYTTYPAQALRFSEKPECIP